MSGAIIKLFGFQPKKLLLINRAQIVAFTAYAIEPIPGVITNTEDIHLNKKQKLYGIFVKAK